jgi:hypothetical protein
LVYATPTLAETVELVHKGVGVRPIEGGRHVGLGTRNYLMSLGEGSYLELIGRDQDQAGYAGDLPFGMDSLAHPRLVSWALRVDGIDGFVSDVRRSGFDPGEVVAMSRRTPDGRELRWRLTRSNRSASPDLFPFLIDWGDTPHPSTTSAQGAKLEGFHLESPEPQRLSRVLAILAVDKGPHVEVGAWPHLNARILGPSGEVTLS